MRVLFSSEPESGLLNHLSVVRELIRRGHDVSVTVHGRLDAPVVRELTNVGYVDSPEPVGEWVALAADVRSSLDFLRFMDERYNDTYRARAWRRVPRPLLVLAPLLRSRQVRSLARRLLEIVERAIPVEADLVGFLERLAPDVLVLTPYLGLRTQQVHVLRAAQSAGLRTAIAVKSWDNLSSKSTLQPIPDRVFVWNEAQRAEADTLHGVDPEKVVVTGAQCFDDLDIGNARDRAAFASRAGVDPELPIILYTCCAPWTGQSELPFVRRWVEALRGSGDQLLEQATVLVRPHPKRADDVPGTAFAGLGPVRVWPEHGIPPVAGDARRDYVDSLAHSAAVVGLNTTAMLEAALFGRPVLTVLDPEYELLQHGTLHFRYMLESGGGLVDVASTLDEHVRHLAAALRDPGAGEARAAHFVRAFLRPYSDGSSATERFADELEKLAAAAPPPRQTTPVAYRPLTYALRRVAARAARDGG